MKRTLLPALVALSLTIINCNSKKEATQEMQADRDVSEQAEEEPALPSAVCIWKEISVRETPSEKGKYLTTVYLGEKLNVLEDTASEKVNDRTYIYQRVQLGDGAQGWVRKEFIAVDAIAGAILSDAMIYKRPDMMTSTNKKFTALDFVAVKTDRDGFSEVIGKRSGDNWFTSGWIPKDKISTEKTDVLFSVLFSKANAISDEGARLEAMKAILDNADLSSSQFYARIYEMYGEGADDSGISEEDTVSASY